MKRRQILGMTAATAWLAGCTSTTMGALDWRGTGDLGVIIERANGTVAIVDTTHPSVLGEVSGLGDLSHAAAVFSRDGRYAYVFGRDGGLSKVDLLQRKLAARVIQAGNSIGGAISADGRLVVAQNYKPGGIKVFDAQTLELLLDLPAKYGNAGQRSRVVGLVDLPGQRFAYALLDANQIHVVDLSDVRAPQTTIYDNVGRMPYDGLVTPDGRHYLTGLFNQDSLAHIDLWAQHPVVDQVLRGYGRGDRPLPVYKMPHLRGWAVAGSRAYLPAVGHHEVLVVDTQTWQEVGRIPVAGQPVFVIARPGGRQVWVTFSVPDYGKVQVIDTQSLAVTHTLTPGKAMMHLEFTPRGESVWLSDRDGQRVVVMDAQTLATQASFPLPSPSGIFFTARANRMGF